MEDEIIVPAEAEETTEENPAVVPDTTDEVTPEIAEEETPTEEVAE